MPIKKNAKKALRQSKRRFEANTRIKEAYKEAVKAVKKALDAGQETTEALRLAQKKLGKAAKKGVLKKNTAARKLSRLVKRANRTKK